MQLPSDDVDIEELVDDRVTKWKIPRREARRLVWNQMADGKLDVDVRDRAGEALFDISQTQFESFEEGRYV